MANVFSGFSDLPDQTSWLTNLGMALSLMGGAQQNRPLEAIHTFGQMQLINARLREFQQQQQAARQQAAFRTAMGSMIAGDLSPIQAGPPVPFDFSRAMALASQDPELAKIIASQPFIEQMRIAGRMPTTAGLFTQQAKDIQAGLGQPTGPEALTIGPEGPIVKREPITSLEGIKAFNLQRLGGGPQEQIQAAQEAGVPLQAATDLRTNYVRLQGQRHEIAQLQAGRDRFGQLLPGFGEDAQRNRRLMVQDLALAEQQQMVENLIAAQENRQPTDVAPEYAPLRRERKQKLIQLRQEFEGRYGKPPTEEELLAEYYGDLLKVPEIPIKPK